MNYPRIVHAVFNSPWAIQRPYLGTVFSVLHSRMFAGEQPQLDVAAWQKSSALDDPMLIAGDLMAGQGRSKAGRFGFFRWGHDRHGRLVNHSARIHAMALQRCGDSAQTYYKIVSEEEEQLDAGQILHVFGSGVLGKHLSSMDEMCSGGLSVDRIQASLKAAAADDKIAAVMLHLDTPGGICYGMAETAAQIRALKENKTVAAFCDSLCASAGYWICGSGEHFYLTPSADVGCVGVYTAHVDYTEWCKKNGISVELITDGGKYKGAGYPGTALTDEQKAKIQDDVNQCSAQFKDDVRAARAGIPDDSMQGQCIFGAKAIDAKLADSLVNDLDAAMEDLAQAI